MEAKDLLLADLDHFGESMLKNEEGGEKRFQFFITLVTAVVGGLVALATSSAPAAAEWLKPTILGSLSVLLVIGLLSYLRILHRNRVTDEYQRTLKTIRETFAAQYEELKHYKVPVRTDHWRGKWLKGGYAETIGAMNGLLLAGLLWGLGSAPAISISCGLALAAVLWWVACDRKK